MPTTASKRARRLVVLLVKPTTYDDRGFPLRFLKGVLPSNSLAAMYALTKQALEDETLPVLGSIIEVLDDAVWNQRISDPEALIRRYDDGQTHVVVALVGVQSNQFPRAVDLARPFKAAGASVVIGGFHVSGSISALYDGIAAGDPRRKDVPCPKKMPDEVVELMDAGIIVCHGEAENIWVTILGDILAGNPKALYRGGQPELDTAPLPEYPEGYFDDFATKIFTFDTSRGCPFACKFCSIINVQGRTMRHRDPHQIVRMVQRICERDGDASFFMTDDNFARNPHWRTILDGLSDLRRRGYEFGFMIEADLASYRIKDFIPKLGEAGCTQVFLGMETVNQEALKAEGKGQNQVKNYERLCNELHSYGIAIHVGYIIGFPMDTKESILADLETVKAVGVDQASFFILTPLPGSEDHVRAWVDGVPMDPDLNNYDSFHAVLDHPHMSRDELRRMVFRSFKEFYRSRQMIAALKRTSPDNFWGLLRNYGWYRNSALGEGTHPMMAGFWSKRSRSDMRPGRSETLPAYLWREFVFRLKYTGHLFREFYIFQHVYFEARGKSELAEQVSQRLERAKGWWRNVFKRPSRRWLNDFWIRYGKQKWKLFWKPTWHVRMLPYAFTEVIYTFYFGVVLLRNLATMTR